MKIVPQINGTVEKREGVCRAALPLPYGGDFSAAHLFPLQRSESPLLLFQTDPSIPAEGYVMEIQPEKIVLSSFDENGAFYGLQTLFQLVRQEKGALPCCRIEDAPRFRYRGFMIDSGRHFFPVDAVKRMIDQCAKLKLNVFHWHLSEDQGFRIESKKFPKLNEIGSWRTEEDGSRYGGFYTQEEIKDVVAYAHAQYMAVVPEIDLPGHTTAMVAAYPELSCSGEPAQVECHWGIFPRILCAGNEKVYDFLYELLDEVCELFPDGYFHIGGDEAPKEEWEKCPKCQEVIREKGLKDEEALQALFTARLVEYLNGKGKTVIGWNEILSSGDLGLGAVAQYWTDQGAEYSAREIPRGRKFIFSNTSSFYFDYDPSLITLKGAYSYEPYIPGGEAIRPEQIFGLEAPLWSERIETPERLEYMSFPRLAALAENAWTKERDYGDFCERLKAYAAVWQEDGIAAQPVEEADRFDAGVSAAAIAKQLRAWMEGQPEEKIREALAQFTAERLSWILSPTFTEAEVGAIVEEIHKLAL